MPVRIFFRGLVLFRFPTQGDDAGKLVAELITEPTGPSGPPGPHHHQTEIQILTGVRHVPPTPLPHGRRIDITVPGKGAVSRSRSFEAHVPKLSELAGGRPRGSQNRDFVRNTITVNRGVIRVRNLVTWDSGGFPIAGNAGETAAHIYGLKVLSRQIEDRPDNTTRFFVIGRELFPPSGHDKTSLLMSVKDKPGALYELLTPFADQGLSMTKIESRPARTGKWEYVFFVEIEGHVADLRVAAAIELASARAAEVKVLGSYPVALL